MISVRSLLAAAVFFSLASSLQAVEIESVPMHPINAPAEAPAPMVTIQTPQKIEPRIVPLPVAADLESTREPVQIKPLSVKRMPAKAKAKQADKPTQASSPARQAIRKHLRHETINVEMLKDAVVLSGGVSSAESAEKAVKLARQFVASDDKVLNFMHVRSGQQVLLRVRIGEVARNGTHAVNYGKEGAFAMGGVANGGVFKLLAEPNLVAISGESAEFSSGGQFPIQGNANEPATYMPYGVKVAFTPLVLAPNRIRLTVAPEVIELDPAGAKVGKLPIFAAHQAKTTVELAPGESFMIAGLIKDNEYLSTSGNGVQHKASELVITVTPYLVDPVAAGDISLPTDHFVIGDELDRMFKRVVAEKSATTLPANTTMQGQSGFIAE